MLSAAQTDFFAIVRERRSVKQYDVSHRLSEQEIKELLEIAGSAPSAWNLQHWKFLVLNDKKAQAKLLPIAYDQRQVAEASVVIAVLGDLEAHLNAEEVYGPDVKAGKLSEEIKSGLVSQIEEAYADASAFPRDEAIRNASLAAMQLMLAAKAAGLDSCPLGGFDPDQFTEAFGVPSRYVPVMLVAIGKAAAPARPSPRFKAERTAVWNRF
ncbi:nitroreductase family protein [Cohnella sp. CIP 111063]|jgi:nitroreductase|uniref:nitroreductase family protein n=1 Tax=unclassified Cohnella TaxID=2636738 RepID=UPI000B8C629F|nr:MULTISPECIES: nitroreductase family protein [unclassified Cohnella]OXS54669.1 nitroreductase family protein [Cohnella sp. CIP 111063]PRX64499.1 nitroreductase [Cohnella sp. SGD-V74]